MKAKTKYTPLFTIKKNDTEFPQVKIKSSLDAYNFIRQFYFEDIEVYESFFILLLNRSKTTVGYAKISQGGISGTVVDIRIIAKYALDSLADAVILAHNHPSGNVQPSDQDINLTKKTAQALKLIDVDICDHVILTKSSYYSFADEGKL